MTESKFKIFLEKYYNSTFNTRRSKRNNPITKVNSCVVNGINPFIEPQIRDFELSIPQECYTTLNENPTTDEIQRCISQYGLFRQLTLLEIQSCLSVEPTTTTTTTQLPPPIICFNNVTFESTSPGCVGYTDCCGNFKTMTVGVGNQTIMDCVLVNSVVEYEDENCTPKATIQSITYGVSFCGCVNPTTTTSTSTSTTSTTTLPLECYNSVTFDVVVPGCVSYTDCCNNPKILEVTGGTVTISGCLVNNSLMAGGGKCLTPSAQIANVVYEFRKCSCPTTTTSTSTTSTTTLPS